MFQITKKANFELPDFTLFFKTSQEEHERREFGAISKNHGEKDRKHLHFTFRAAVTGRHSSSDLVDGVNWEFSRHRVGSYFFE